MTLADLAFPALLEVMVTSAIPAQLGPRVRKVPVVKLVLWAKRVIEYVS